MARFQTNDIMPLARPAPRYDLGESIGPSQSLRNVLELDDVTLAYGSAEGDPLLRAAIAARHDVAADDVVVTAGGMHALFLLAFNLCDPGDEAVTTLPLFPLARSALEAVGARIRPVRVRFDARYQPNVSDIRAELSKETKLVGLASPQNPSGVAIPAETVQAIIDVMQKVCPQATLLVDETYREAVYGDNPVAPSVVSLSPKVVSVASLSKCHGAPGLRIGWAVTRDQVLRQELVAGKFRTIISCSAVDEALAVRVLAQSQHERRHHFAAGLSRTEAWVKENADRVEWLRPDAGAICCIRLRPEVFSEDAVERFYVQLASEGVRVASGAWFDDDARIFRLGFGILPMPDLDGALAAIARALDAVSGT